MDGFQSPAQELLSRAYQALRSAQAPRQSPPAAAPARTHRVRAVRPTTWTFDFVSQLYLSAKIVVSVQKLMLTDHHLGFPRLKPKCAVQKGSVLKCGFPSPATVTRVD